MTFKEAEELLTFKVGEIHRVKGWVFRIVKANRFRLVLEPLPGAEVEALMAETLLRGKHSQLVDYLKDASVTNDVSETEVPDINETQTRATDELRTSGEGIDTPGAGLVPER